LMWEWDCSESLEEGLPIRMVGFIGPQKCSDLRMRSEECSCSGC
jgi:hypothetical protein